MATGIYAELLVYLVTDFVPSDTACLASSPGSSNRTEVCTSREVRVLFLLYLHKSKHVNENQLHLIQSPPVHGGHSPCQADSLSCQAVEGIIDEGVHDGHSLLGDTSLCTNIVRLRMFSMKSVQVSR
jgi:hypothetical protein